MSLEGQNFYPGENATAAQIAILAIEYHGAAIALLKLGRRGEPLSWAPYRLIALHAVELYLHAFLATAGHSSAARRSTRHDLGVLAHRAIDAQLRLRKRTLDHLQKVTANREYLSSRYDPCLYHASHLNQLSATLSDVASKVTRSIDRSVVAEAT